MAVPISGASTTRDRSRDTGLALVLLLLMRTMATGRDGFTTAALVVLVVAMTVPLLFRPAVSRLVRFLARAGHRHVEGAAGGRVLSDRHPGRRRPPAARLRLAAAAGVQAQRRLGAAPAQSTSSWPATSTSRTDAMEFLRDLWGFLSQRKKFWLLPVIVALVGFGALIVLTQRIGDRTVHLHAVLVVARQAILGISAFYHDSAAALLVDGEIVAAAQEERFSRKRHDASFPINACRYVLDEGGVPLRRPGGGGVLRQAVPEIRAPARDLPRVRARGSRQLRHGDAGLDQGEAVHAAPARASISASSATARHRILYPEHHLSHAASAFYPSPFDEAAILTIDGVGEWATTTIGRGRGSDIEILSELHFPHSVGLLYSAFTYYLGFTVNSGEYKLMGLAPYGHAGSARVRGFADTITRELVDVRPDGSLVLNMAHFEFATGLRMVHEPTWERLFGMPRRAPDVELTQAHMDLALAIQQVTEEIVLRLARTARTADRLPPPRAGRRRRAQLRGQRQAPHERHLRRHLDSARGRRRGRSGRRRLRRVAHPSWPAAGSGWRTRHLRRDGGQLPRARSSRICDTERTIRAFAARAAHDGRSRRAGRRRRRRLAAGQVGGWFQGRMEFGPRALGNRSILGDARNPEMQKRLNLKVKFREGFRPFAPSVLEEDVAEHFELDRPSPYMLLVAPVRAAQQRAASAGAARGAALRPPLLPAVASARGHPRGLLGAHPDREPRHQPALLGAAAARSRRSPAAACSSTPASTSAASRSSARPTTPTGASCAPTWTSW